MAKKRVVIIGGGPAGIEAAKAAASVGPDKVHVTLISDGPIGGRAGWHSLIPSKVWLAAADTYGLVKQANKSGIHIQDKPKADVEAVLARIREVSTEWNTRQQNALETLGVKIVPGTSSLVASNQVVVINQDGVEADRLDADAIILTGGSVPRFPPEMEPDGKRILAPRFASHLHSLPDDIIVVGAGATSSEFVYLFNRLGVQVTWIVDEFGVLPTFDPEGGKFLLDRMLERGIKVIQGEMALRIESQEDCVVVTTSGGGHHAAAAAFIGIGRIPDLSRLNLSAAGLEPDLNSSVQIDEFCQTAEAGIYAVGDATGGPMIANKAIAQARTAGRHAAGVATSPFRPETVIHAIYSEPQIAQVGQLEADHEPIHTINLPYASALKAHLLVEGTGFIKVGFNPETRRIRGALAAGFHAADVLAPIALAIQTQATLEDLAAISPAHPTISELAFLAAVAALDLR